MSTDIDATITKRFRCLQHLSSAELATMLDHLERVQLAAGQVLFQQGEPGDGAYLVESGQVELNVRVPEQGTRVLAMLHDGSLFGEISPVLDEPRSATAIARTTVQLWRIPKAALQNALQSGEVWMSKFLLATVRVLAQRLLVVNQEVNDLIGDLRKTETRPPVARVAELERLRNHLNTEWSF